MNFVYKQPADMESIRNFEQSSLWSSMMSVFHNHAHSVVQAAKCLFQLSNQQRILSNNTKVSIVKNAMYGLTMIKLADDFDEQTGNYNYFNFSPFEREQILKSFPNFERIGVQFQKVGRCVKEFDVNDDEKAFICALHLFQPPPPSKYSESAYFRLSFTKKFYRFFVQFCRRKFG